MVLQFLLDRQRHNPQGWAPGAFFKVSDLYPEFERWAKAAGLKPWTRRTFEKALAEGAGRYGLRRERTQHSRGYLVERLIADGGAETPRPTVADDARVVGLRKALQRHRAGVSAEAEGSS